MSRPGDLLVIFKRRPPRGRPNPYRPDPSPATSDCDPPLLSQRLLWTIRLLRQNRRPRTASLALPARKSPRDLRVAEVVGLDVTVANGKVVAYRAKVELQAHHGNHDVQARHEEIYTD